MFRFTVRLSISFDLFNFVLSISFDLFILFLSLSVTDLFTLKLRSFAKPARDPRYYFFHNNPIQVKILLIYARVMRAACSRTRVPSEPGSVWQLRPVWHTRVRSLIANGVPCFFRYMVIFIYIYIPGIILKKFVLSKNPISVFIVTHA